MGKADAPAGTQPQIRDFIDLNTWKMARALRASIYKVCKRFPKDELFGLTSQIRRAAISITANIAEGYGRFSYQENVQFCRQSRGSVYELRDHLTTAFDAGYISSEDYRALDEQAKNVLRMINGYIRATKKRKADLPAGKT